MNENNFNNGQPMNNQNIPVGPQPNPGMGMPEMNMQPNSGMGMPEMNMQPNSGMGMPEMNMQPNPGMGYNNGSSYNQNPMNVPQGGKKPINLPLIIGIAVGGIAVVVLILFLTGILGGKKLTCSREESYMGMTTKEELIISFNGEKPSKITSKQTIDYGKNKEYKEFIKEGFEEQVEYAKEQGYDAKLTSGSTSYTLTMTISKDDIPNTIEDDETSYENVKEYFEEEGYTCK